MQIRKTKIVCSLGPVSRNDSSIRRLLLAGMNIVRLNLSHDSHEAHRSAIECVRRVSSELGICVAILLDTKGPEIRTGEVENDGHVKINAGESVIVSVDGCFTIPAEGKTPAKISISWKDAPEKLQKGHHILIADGLLDLEVLGIENNGIICIANNAAEIGSRKNVNLIGIHAHLPILSEQDKKDIAFGAEMNVDYIAASFLSFPHEITEIKNYLGSLNSNIKIIAKIENGEGLENIKEIAKLADGVMVARGDLGVQLPTEEIPLAQKHIISVCRRVGRPVITATQMLESMIVNPRPTRAELTDVANAVLDGTDAIMLSGETAVGAYPTEAVKIMDKIACTIEKSKEFRMRMKEFRSECLSYDHNPDENLGIIMSRYGINIASSVGAKAIVTPTLSGNSARLLSIFKPDEPILALTHDKQAERFMQLYWGVITCHSPQVDESESLIQKVIKASLDTGIAGMTDKIMLLAGLPLKSPVMMNNIRVLILGTILARSGEGGAADPSVTRRQGRVFHASNPKEARERIIALGASFNEILVCKNLTKDYLPIIRIVNGIICEGASEIDADVLHKINPNLVWLTHTKNAVEKLEPGITVTLDTEQLFVYEGAL